jgi:integrase
MGYNNPKKTKEIRASGTIEKNLTFLNAIYNEAWRKNLISEKALKVMKHRTRLEGNIRQDFMEYHHFEEIHKNLCDTLKLPYKICYMYGMRKRECLDLEWIDINLKKGSIRLSKTKTKVPRTIYVDDEIKKELQEHHKNGKNKRRSRYVFPQEGKTTPVNNNYFYKNFKNAVEDSGFDDKFIWHDTRRSAVRDMIRSGLSEGIAMKISGHKSRSIFERYNIVSEADLKIGAEMRRKYFEEQKDSEPWRVD